jgi:hypothetical protein
MATTRNNSQAKSAAAHGSLTAVTYGRPAWGEPSEHGGETHSFSERFRLHTVRLNFGGRVYSGCSRESESDARARAFAVAADRAGLPVSEVMDNFYGDADEAAGWGAAA